MSVARIERSRRFLVRTSRPFCSEEIINFRCSLYDRMTETVIGSPLQSFDAGTVYEEVRRVDVLGRGKDALIQINTEKGLGFDEWDIEFYTNMFVNTLKRNPTDVECFDLAQSNSEHSRHWFFGGKMVIDGIEKPGTLFDMVKGTLVGDNSVIAFHDNSSSIRGGEVLTILPVNPTSCSSFVQNRLTLHPILTAETHNFPTGVAPFAGAETGTGGRLRDVMATGQGAYTIAGICAYCVGNLNIPGNPMPWEIEHADALAMNGTSNVPYASNLASPLDIVIEASNGASDYGNKYGEPVVGGFTRSFGQRLPSGQRQEWIKPIMFTAGIGQINAIHVKKGEPQKDMIVCKIGGPCYRIGMGGGAASSRPLGSDETDAFLDFDAVQRGDAEMENRMNRVIRACADMADRNPIVSIHDQGAGGNGNVLKEICDPLGAVLEIRALPVGDPTLSVLEIWGAEYQENNAFLCSEEDLSVVLELSRRENCPVTAVGKVTDSGRVIVRDSLHGDTPFDLPLSLVLGKMPQKEFRFETCVSSLRPLTLPNEVTPLIALSRVLRLLDVGSKRFLTNKVDRSVTGLIAQQQCVGPLHTPLADVSVIAQSHYGITGIASSVGEQPIKGLVDTGAQARMTVGECLTNLMFAQITVLEDVKSSCNWMWAAKLEDEGSRMYSTCHALCECLKKIGVSIDGGKDSLSMAAKVGEEIVRSPGEVTLTAYAFCPDITKTVTPDLKAPGIGELILVELSPLNDEMQPLHRLGGSALSTVYSQIGNETADMNDPVLFKRMFNAVQLLVKEELILSGHDRSDGGLITTLLEMAFAGNTGLSISFPSILASGPTGVMGLLFGEELGAVLEVLPHNVERVMSIFTDAGVLAYRVGKSTAFPDHDIRVTVGDDCILTSDMKTLRMIWESTSFSLERLQCKESCVAQEEKSMCDGRFGPSYRTTFKVTPTPLTLMSLPLLSDPGMMQTDGTINPLAKCKPRVAILRQEGTNGDREMAAAFHSAGFDAWDVNMRDLQEGKIGLSSFRGIVFCGGFSFADCHDSAKGWAGSIIFNTNLLSQFEDFRSRPDTFSLGICNGCQLMALLGWVPFSDISLHKYQPRFIHNNSQRFESRFSTVRIMDSNSIMLKGMEGSTLGVWVAHGEGRAYFPNPGQLEEVEEQKLAPIRYVDDDSQPTEQYPMNPNGSPNGIAGLCSADGRHLAMMPHPERCFLTWQLPHLPLEWKQEMHWSAAPWLKMFQNARDFCDL